MLARLITTIFALYASLGVTGSSAEEQTIETEGWYQVEVIVFKNNQSQSDPSDERWLTPNRVYPNTMVSIDPASSSALRPFTPSHMQDLEDYLALWEEQPDMPIIDTSEDEFLFESRSASGQSRPTLSTISDISPTEPESAFSSEPINFEQLFDNQNPIAYRALPASMRLLNPMARSVRRSRNYSLLAHKSWLQPIMSDEQAHSVLIQSGAHYNNTYEIDGTISISRSRFLHVDTNLWFTQFVPMYEASSDTSSLDLTASEPQLRAQSQENAQLALAKMNITPLDFRPLTSEQRQRYPEVVTWLQNRDQYLPIQTHKMQQSRRMRSSTVHFLDHPHFGVIITTERYTSETSTP